MYTIKLFYQKFLCTKSKDIINHGMLLFRHPSVLLFVINVKFFGLIIYNLVILNELQKLNSRTYGNLMLLLLSSP